MRKTIILIFTALLALSACNNHRVTHCWFHPTAKEVKEAEERAEAQRQEMLGRMMKNLVGIDVSHHQGFIEWQRVIAGRPDIQFVYVKLTEGASHIDSRAAKNFSGAASVGLPVGGYHYFRMTSGAKEQFEHFKKNLDHCMHGQRHVLIPMVDVETADGHKVQDVQDSLQVMLTLLEDYYGKRPIIYGTMRSYNTLLAPDFNDYPLYIGRFGINEPEVNDGDYTVWQFSEKGHIDGIPKNVDLCRFHKGMTIDDITLWNNKEYYSR